MKPFDESLLIKKNLITEEIRNGKLHFLCSANHDKHHI